MTNKEKRQQMLDDPANKEIKESIIRKNKDTIFIRTCQECGNEQVEFDPSIRKTDSWQDIKCKKCKSEGSLDYGSSRLRYPLSKEELEFLFKLDELDDELL